MDAMQSDSPISSLSPSLQPGVGEAFELKLLLPQEQAPVVEAWARERLTPDPHGQGGVYRILSTYCDTPALDVFHRSRGFRRRKYRVRRYDDGPEVHLERKARKGDWVRKKREVIAPELLGLLATAEPDPDLPWGWFLRQVRYRGLQPTCRVTYRRMAFVGTSPEGGIRLTLDHDVVGAPATGWELKPVTDGRTLLPGSVMLELKYPVALPGLFRELLAELTPQPGRMSKYRLCVSAWGMA